ncbi:putative nuclease HARBI1 [Dermacentor albipictus]|uniref:putative nuclease HARBI1 n=1 Tax=Dermacentor albipictus TaxID=60249 RepID=UPI0038FC569E
MPDDHFLRHFRLSKETVRLLCEELAGELSVKRKVLCALRFFATGSFQASVGSEETIPVWQSTMSYCVALVNGDFLRSHFPQICDADMRILAVDSMRPGSDHDSFVWRTTWLGRWFHARGAHPESREILIGDSGYPLTPWLLILVPGHPSMRTAVENYDTAYAAMRSVVESYIGLLKSRFRCPQRYRTLLNKPERGANIVAACATLHNL